MTLTQQFLILSILPLSFLVLVGQIQRPQRQHRTSLIGQWTVTLLLAAIWSSGTLTYFLGRNASVIVTYNWQILARYAFGLLGAGVLITTTTYLSRSVRQRNLPLVLFALFWVGAILLDPLIHLVRFEAIELGGRLVTQFDAWAALWATSWFLPLFAAWVLTRQAHRNVPTSLYRNQVNYWLFALTGFMVGGLPALIQQRGGSGWLQMGVLLTIAAAAVATLSLTRDRLPDLQITLRQNLRRLLFVVVIFLLTTGGILLLTQTPTGGLIAGSLPGLMLAAAGFALLVALLYRVINRLFIHFTADSEEQGMALLPPARLSAHLSDPQSLAQTILTWVQQQWRAQDGWLMVVEENGEQVVLRPQASLDETLPQPATFSLHSPFIRYLKRHPNQPLVQYDIDILNEFEGMSIEERDTLHEWKRLLYLPLHAGDLFIGMLALGIKEEQGTYSSEDFGRLSLFAHQIGPVFYLVRELSTLRQTYFLETSDHQEYIERAGRWEAVAKLYRQFLHLISPDLRKAFGTVETQWQRTYNEVNRNDAIITIPDHLTKPMADFKVTMDRLISVSGRIQKQSEFRFATVNLDRVVRGSLGSLAAMAEARRVNLNVQANSPNLPDIRGDEQRLQEAVQYLLHNAIKFNKIGGRVDISFGRQDETVYIRITDNGVGIPEDRLAIIWLGLTQLNQVQFQGAGMGLGLPLARFITEAHGGQIEAQSHYGSGSTFTIYLPLPRSA